MKLIVKVGNKWPANHPSHLKGWRDGQIVDIRPNDYKEGRMGRKHLCIIETPHDFWELRGSKDWKVFNKKVAELKKFICPADRNGKMPWEFGYLKEKRIRPRDWFIDYKRLLDNKWISINDFRSIYDKGVATNKIYIDRDLSDYLLHEDGYTRLKSEYSDTPGSISAGTHSIGSGLDYGSVSEFESVIAAQLTGDLTGEHADEETTISSVVAFDTDTNGYLLKLTAASGAEHNGTFGNPTHQAGDGARVSLGSYDAISFDETNDGDLADVEVSNLVIDAGGDNNIGVHLADCGKGGLARAFKLVIKGDSTAYWGVRLNWSANVARIENSIVFGFTRTDYGGIEIYADHFPDNYQYLYNNTIAKCNYGIVQHQSGAYGVIETKNNLCQGNTTDYVDNGAGFGTHAYNVSEDATSPDADYRNKDVHTNSVFKDYANDDYRLDPNGDATNLAILDDGEDLSSIFTDDIQGQTRSTWYIGASEIVTGTTVDVSLIIALSSELTNQSQTSARSSIVIANNPGLASSGHGNTKGNVIITGQTDLSFINNAAAFADINFEISSAISLSAHAQASAVLTIGYNHGINTSAYSEVSRMIGIAIQSGLDVSIVAEKFGSLSVGLKSGINTGGQSAAQGSLTINNVLTLITFGEALASAGLPIDCVQSVSVNGSIISASVTLPDGRTLTIKADSRIYTVMQETRIYNVR